MRCQSRKVLRNEETDYDVLSGSLTLKYIDAKGRVVNQRITVGGVATGGTAAGTVTPKGDKAKVFAAEFE